MLGYAADKADFSWSDGVVLDEQAREEIVESGAILPGEHEKSAADEAVGEAIASDAGCAFVSFGTGGVAGIGAIGSGASGGGGHGDLESS